MQRELSLFNYQLMFVRNQRSVHTSINNFCYGISNVFVFGTLFSGLALGTAVCENDFSVCTSISCRRKLAISSIFFFLLILFSFHSLSQQNNALLCDVFASLDDVCVTQHFYMFRGDESISKLNIFRDFCVTQSNVQFTIIILHTLIDCDKAKSLLFLVLLILVFVC